MVSTQHRQQGSTSTHVKASKSGPVKSHRHPLLTRIQGVTREASAKLINHVAAPLTNICLSAGSVLLRAASNFGTLVSSAVTQAAENDTLRGQVLDLQQEVERLRSDKVQYANTLFRNAIMVPNHIASANVTANNSNSSSSSSSSSSSDSRKRTHPGGSGGGSGGSSSSSNSQHRQRALADEGRRLLESISSFAHLPQPGAPAVSADPHVPVPVRPSTVTSRQLAAVAATNCTEVGAGVSKVMRAVQAQPLLSLQLPSECMLSEQEQASANTVANARCSLPLPLPLSPAFASTFAPAPAPSFEEAPAAGLDVRSAVVAATTVGSGSSAASHSMHLQLQQQLQTHAHTHAHTLAKTQTQTHSGPPQATTRRRVSFGPDDVCEVPHLCDANAPPAPTNGLGEVPRPAQQPALPSALLASISMRKPHATHTAAAACLTVTTAGGSSSTTTAARAGTGGMACLPSLPFNSSDLLSIKLNPNAATTATTASEMRANYGGRSQRRTSLERLSPALGRAVNTTLSRAFNASDIRSVRLKPVGVGVGSAAGGKENEGGNNRNNRQGSGSSSSSRSSSSDGKPLNLQDSLRLALAARFANALPHTPRTVPHTPGYESDASDWM